MHVDVLSLYILVFEPLPSQNTAGRTLAMQNVTTQAQQGIVRRFVADYMACSSGRIALSSFADLDKSIECLTQVD